MDAWSAQHLAAFQQTSWALSVDGNETALYPSQQAQPVLNADAGNATAHAYLPLYYEAPSLWELLLGPGTPAPHAPPPPQPPR